jgi:hypothetical protein
MRLWIDDVRPAPDGYVWCRSVNEAKTILQNIDWDNTAMYDGVNYESLELIDIDHDAGDYASDGGDYIKLLDWLEETGRNYPIRIHSMNPVGVANMRQVIQRNGWTEVK